MVTKNHTLLFVDEINVLNPVWEACAQRGSRVLKSGHVNQAMKLVEAAEPHAILADLHVSGGGAMYLLSLVRRQERKILFFCFVPNHSSGFADARKDIEAMGADAIIPIPFETEDVVKRLESHLLP